MDSIAIELNGIVFRRYPESPRWNDRLYFTPGKADRQNGVRRYHQEVWIEAHGPIPDGCHIHHVDFDPLNNDVSNLACLDEAEHELAHMERSIENGKRNPPSDLARQRAAEWHRSDEGRAWHREHGVRTWLDRKPVERSCTQCGTTFETLKMDESVRFCSNACKAKQRRDSGIDDVERNCECCGALFVANRYDKRRFCGRPCSVRHAARKSCGCVQSEGRRGA